MSDIKNYKSKKKSISSSQILPCNYQFNDAKLIMHEMLQSGCYRLFKQKFVTSLIHLFIGYGDRKKDVAKGSVRMNITTNLFSKIQPFADKLFDQIVDKNRPIRVVGYDMAELENDENEQYDMFTNIDDVKREKKLIQSILQLQEKYGKNTILKAYDLDEKATIKERNSQIGGHKSGES